MTNSAPPVAVQSTSQRSFGSPTRGRNNVRNACDHGESARNEHRPLAAKQRTAAEGDRQLRRTGDAGP
jgi:hypothetical protein